MNNEMNGAELARIYDEQPDKLLSLGYEMSDDERGLMDGTHPIFKEDL